MVRAEEREESTLLERSDRQTVSGVGTLVVPEAVEEGVIACWHLRRPLRLALDRRDQHLGEHVADRLDVFLTELQAWPTFGIGFRETPAMAKSHPRDSVSGE